MVKKIIEAKQPEKVERGQIYKCFLQKGWPVDAPDILVMDFLEIEGLPHVKVYTYNSARYLCGAVIIYVPLSLFEEKEEYKKKLRFLRLAEDVERIRASGCGGPFKSPAAEKVFFGDED